MKRTQRITRSIDFKRVRQIGKSYAHPLVVFILAKNDQGMVRVGFVTGQRVGGAVQRNRAKRQMRAILHELYPHLAPGWDMIFIARPAITTAHFKHIQGALTGLIKRAGVFIMDGIGSVPASGLPR